MKKRNSERFRSREGSRAKRVISKSLYLKGKPSPRFEGQSRKDDEPTPNSSFEAEFVNIIIYDVLFFQANKALVDYLSHFRLSKIVNPPGGFRMEVF